MIRSAIAFAACGLALLAVQFLGVRRDLAAPSVDVFEHALANRVVRVAIVVLWWWLGWHFLVGQTVDPPA